MQSWSELIEILIKELNLWVESFVRALPNMVIAAIIFCIFLVLARTIKRLLTNVLNRVSVNPGVNGILTTGVFIFTVVVGLFISLGVLNLEKTVTSMLAGAGVIGIALGFAFQEIASNFIAGIFIAFMRPFSVGDVVEIDGTRGVIKRIDIRTTSMLTSDDTELIIPNKEMFTKTLKNFTTTPKRRVEIMVGVSYAEDLRRVKDVAASCLETLPHRIPTEPINAAFTSFGDSAINLSVQIWITYPGTDNFGRTIDEAIIRLKEAFEQAGIVIPFPVRTLDFAIKGGESLAQQMNNPTLNKTIQR